MTKIVFRVLLAALLCIVFGSQLVYAQTRPMKMDGTGTLTFITNETGEVVGGTLSASGTATHLGEWTQHGTLLFAPHPTDPTLILASGDFVFTADDGDAIYAAVTDAILDTGTGIATGRFDFVDGTGRFQQASGSAQFTVVQDLANGTFDVSATGTIDY